MNILKKKFRLGIFFVLGVSIFMAEQCLALDLDWIKLHERSGQINLKEALDLVPEKKTSISDLYLLGLEYLDVYDGAQAQKVFQLILDRNPDVYPARWGRVEALRAQHQLDQSKQILERFIKDYPEFVPAYISLAYIYYIETDFAQSSKLTAQVIRMDPSSVDLPNQVRAHGLYAAAKGMLAEYGGPLTKSINFFAVKKHLAIAQKLDPQSPVVLLGYGTYYMIIPSVVGRDLDKAQTLLKEAIAKDPRFPDPYVRLAQIYRYRGDLAKYNEFLNKALALDPQNELAKDIQTRVCRFICLDER